MTETTERSACKPSPSHITPVTTYIPVSHRTSDVPTLKHSVVSSVETSSGYHKTIETIPDTVPSKVVKRTVTTSNGSHKTVTTVVPTSVKTKYVTTVVVTSNGSKITEKIDEPVSSKRTATLTLKSSKGTTLIKTVTLPDSVPLV